MTFSCINNFCNYIINIIDDTRVIKYDNLKIKHFICTSKPHLSIDDYIRQILYSGIIDKNNIDGAILYTINMLKYLKNKNINLDSYNCHRIILTLLKLSSKIHEDYYYSNSYWAKISGTTKKDINIMELVILELLNYDLHIIISQEKALSIYKSIY